MNLPLVQVDAFSQGPFSGNPAAVIPLQEWLSEKTMQQIAQEINLSETAFFVPNQESFDLRWFTPVREVRLCGHATLATAHALYEHFGYNEEQIIFNTKSGPLYVRKEAEMYQMNFPANKPTEIEPVADLKDILGCSIKSMHNGNDDFLAIIDNEEQLMELAPNFSDLAKLDMRGLVVSTKSEQYDIASRCFYPKYGVNEDPATGSAHTMLIPYWAEVLGKKNIHAIQRSQRTGILHCSLEEDRVILSGKAVTTITGELHL